MRTRYRARRIGWDTRELAEATTHADGSPVEPYGIWDTQAKCWVNQYGEPDEDYWATSRQVAMARARDLREAVAVS